MAAHLKCIKYIDEILELTKFKGKKVCQLGSVALRESAKNYIVENYDLQGGSAGGLSGHLERIGFDVTVIDIGGKRKHLSLDLGLPVEDESLIGSFDLIVGYALIEHIENQYELFKNIHNLCKVGGTVILNCPTTGSYVGHGTWTYDFDFFLNLFKWCKYKIHDSRAMPLKYGRVRPRKLVTFVSYGKQEESVFVERKNFTFPRFDKIGYEKDKELYDRHGPERKTAISYDKKKQKGSIKGHSIILIDTVKKEGIKKFAEIGVWKSSTAKRLLVGAGDIIEEYWAVDPWELMPDGSKSQKKRTKEHWVEYHKFACALMLDYPQLKVVKLSSEEAVKFIPDGYFDMVYIDAIHDFEHMYEDIGFWLPKVRKGGLISGHDYGGKWVGVKEAVDRWFGEGNVKVWEVDEVWIKRV